uniref:Uncharacterized protein n=1 Tax=Ananas comosus var. bracteatus TaxID=296719 RepID=A0A6V7PXR8_ANACO|nr:unnamed protein product [Ananas comosus var. bracteatus]
MEERRRRASRVAVGDVGADHDVEEDGLLEGPGHGVEEEAGTDRLWHVLILVLGVGAVSSLSLSNEVSIDCYCYCYRPTSNTGHGSFCWSIRRHRVYSVELCQVVLLVELPRQTFRPLWASCQCVSLVFGSDVAACIVVRGIRFDFWGYLGMDWVAVRSLVGGPLGTAAIGSRRDRCGASLVVSIACCEWQLCSPSDGHALVICLSVEQAKLLAQLVLAALNLFGLGRRRWAKHGKRKWRREHFILFFGFLIHILYKALRIQTYGHEMSTDRCIMSCSILFGDRALLANLPTMLHYQGICKSSKVTSKHPTMHDAIYMKCNHIKIFRHREKSSCFGMDTPHLCRCRDSRNVSQRTLRQCLGLLGQN